jgi:hypothetical protein
MTTGRLKGIDSFGLEDTKNKSLYPKEMGDSF